MKFVVRITDNGRTHVVRRNFDKTPTRAELDACVSEVLGLFNYSLSSPEPKARKKVAKKAVSFEA